jgi:hypothetical protein
VGARHDDAIDSRAARHLEHVQRPAQVDLIRSPGMQVELIPDRGGKGNDPRDLLPPGHGQHRPKVLDIDGEDGHARCQLPLVARVHGGIEAATAMVRSRSWRTT